MAMSMQRSDREPHACALTIAQRGSSFGWLIPIAPFSVLIFSRIQGATWMAVFKRCWQLSGSNLSAKITRCTLRSNMANRIPSRPCPQQRSATIGELIDFRILANSSNDSKTSFMARTRLSASAWRKVSCRLLEAKNRSVISGQIVFLEFIQHFSSMSLS